MSARLRFATAAALLTACGCMPESPRPSPPPQQITLAGALLSRPADFSGRQVTTCGYATREFEHNVIREHVGSTGPALGVVWCEREPRFSAEFRCVTGRVEPTRPDGLGRAQEGLYLGYGGPYRLRESCEAPALK